MEDLDYVSHIEAECFPEAEAAPKSALKERLSVYPEGFFVAELDGKIIGFINGGLTNHNHIEDVFFENMDFHMHDGKNILIFGLDVHPQYQKNGYAQALMEHFIDSAKKKGIKNILLTCKEHLITFYEQFGYINEGVSKSVHGGAKWYDMYLKINE